MQFYHMPLNFSAHSDLMNSARIMSGNYGVTLPTGSGMNAPFGIKPFPERFDGHDGYLVAQDSPNDAPVISSSNVAPYSGRSVSQGALKPQTLDYLNAELASAYGMSRSTAYQEALSNTSYQRAVKDMKAAGLNPAVLFGAGRGAPAQSSVYAASDQSSGKRVYGRSSSAKSQLFSSSMYSALSAIGGLVGIALTGRPDGYWVGSQTTQGAMGLMNAAYSVSQNK